MKRQETDETKLGVRLVRPHTPECSYSQQGSAFGTFYVSGEQVRRDRSGRNRRGYSRWLLLPCLLGNHGCNALAMIRCDKIEEIVENTLAHMMKSA